MDVPSIIILSIYVFGFFIVTILLIYLIFRRVKIKDTENFEKRDN